MQFSFSRQRTALPPIAAVVLALIMPLALPLAAFAQDDDAAPAVTTTGGVARIDALSGDVAIQRGDSNDTVAAVANAPVLGADYVTTGVNGRAEVGFDGRSAVRLGENVQIRFSKVDANDRQMQLAAGTIDLRLFGDADGQSAIDTPSISVVPRSAGSFRVSVDNNGETAVTVRSGRADIVTPQGTQPLEAGTTLIADGAASNPQVQTQQAIAQDGFDGYNNERDHIYQLATADSQYANDNIQGLGDLNANGRWVDDSSYGHVWIPATVGTDWAPYRDGNWTWEDGYGWTWVAAEPWGWAPYHYGRWYFSTAYHHWAWYPPAPGRFAPAWSPALVGFVGFNIGAVNVGIGFGNVGWVPLAPFEAFHPWWGRGASFGGNATIVTNNVNVNIHYRNLTVNNAMTSVTREDFQGGRFNHPVAVSSEQLRTMQTTSFRGALPIVPSQANLRFTQRTVAPSLAARPAFAARAFAGRPAVATRTPFVEQQASVSRVTHVAYRSDAGAASFTRPAPANAPSFARGADTNAAPAARAAGGDSWSRFNANRSADTAAPGYARSASVAPAYSRPAAAAAVPRAATPSFARSANAGYDRGTTGESGASRAPQYTRPDSYARQASPGYTRQATPTYNRQSAPAYSRPANTQRTQPQARATHENEGRHDH